MTWKVHNKWIENFKVSFFLESCTSHCTDFTIITQKEREYMRLYEFLVWVSSS